MDPIITIKYAAIFIVAAYFSGLIVVIICEIRIKQLYRRMRQQMKLLTNLQSSGAVLHAKTYKIAQDYHRLSLPLESLQQGISKRLLLTGRMSHSLSSFTIRNGG
jgi:hypothetical protein